MAFFDNFNNPLYAPVQSGLKFFEGMNIFGAKPSEALTGILSPAEQEKLQNQALAQGVLGGLATYLSTPKNLGAGSPLPYLGKAYLGGMQQSQGAFDTALKSRMDSITMAKNMKELEMAGMTDVQKLLKAKNDLNPNSPTYKGDLTALDAAINKLTNVDSTFNHVQPFTFTLGQGQVIKGWDEGIALLKKGGKARLFIPSHIAYGAQSPSPAIPANSVLIFDVEVVNIEEAK